MPCPTLACSAWRYVPHREQHCSQAFATLPNLPRRSHIPDASNGLGCLNRLNLTAAHSAQPLRAWEGRAVAHPSPMAPTGALKVQSLPCQAPRPPDCPPPASCAARLPLGRVPTRLPSCGGGRPGEAGLLPGAGPCAWAEGPCSSELRGLCMMLGETAVQVKAACRGPCVWAARPCSTGT